MGHFRSYFLLPLAILSFRSKYVAFIRVVFTLARMDRSAQTMIYILEYIEYANTTKRWLFMLICNLCSTSLESLAAVSQKENKRCLYLVPIAQ